MKHKNSELPANALLSLFAVVTVACIILYCKLNIDTYKSTADKIMENSDEMCTDYEEYDMAKYDGEEIRGSEVINYIKKNLGEYTSGETAPNYIRVVTKVSGSEIINDYMNNEHIKDIKNISETDHYIKPTAIFDAEVIRSGNKVILGICFTQK